MLCLNGQLNKAVPGIDIVELNVVIESFFSERHRFVDLHRFRELSVRLQVTSLVGRVLEDDVSLAVLVVTKANLKNIAAVMRSSMLRMIHKLWNNLGKDPWLLLLRLECC